jgi:hypothetical protein
MLHVVLRLYATQDLGLVGRLRIRRSGGRANLTFVSSDGIRAPRAEDGFYMRHIRYYAAIVEGRHTKAKLKDVANAVLSPKGLAFSRFVWSGRGVLLPPVSSTSIFEMIRCESTYE